MALRIAYKNESSQTIAKTKKLSMDKDPVFLAGLREQIIKDHNRKVRNRSLSK